MELFHSEKYKNKRVCVALSGGVDSVCLLHVFKEQAEKYRIALSAYHIEHGIRGEESLRDMAFCESLCKEWGIPLTVQRVDVPKLVKEQGGNLESVARSVRYGAFHALLEEGEADLVATAHHAGDVAETVLFRLARGTGLSGMRAVTEYGGIVRPLLACTRAEIEAYASEKNLPHVEDSTNGDENYTRNYIRKTVLPAFEKIHGNAAKHLVAFASLAAEEDAFLQALAESKVVHIAGEAHVPVDLPDVLFRRAVYEIVRDAHDADYTRAAVEEVLRLRASQSGRKVCFGAICAFREGADIVFCREEAASAAEIPFTPADSDYALPAPFSVRETESAAAEGALLADLDAFPEGCVVRTRREGDVIASYHAPRKTLKKFLTDRKISARLSKKLPVIAKGNEIYAVVGVEISDAVKVTVTTKRRGIILQNL